MESLILSQIECQTHDCEKYVNKVFKLGKLLSVENIGAYLTLEFKKL